MGFNCGIVGLPNVGKSTIFSALTATNVSAENYPFCTIEPNTGVVPVPDERIAELARIAKSAKLVPTTVEFVDIAGLVKGASKGEGLGNQFLGHIRAVDAVVHVVRCFDDSDVVHVDGSPSPRRDIEVIETELMLADLTVVEKRIDKVRRSARSGDKEAKEELIALEVVLAALEDGKMLNQLEEVPEILAPLGLITAKPFLLAGNVAEEQAAHDISKTADGYLGELLEVATERGYGAVVISGKVEAEIASLDDSEREMFLEELGLEQSGLDRLALAGYSLLKLITFFTVGPKEVHAWTCQSNTPANKAAGVIHTDFEKGFIRAEVISYDDYVSCGGEQGAKEKGLLRVEGKTYEVKDGDTLHFRFNV
ncbi:UNVERIFIED_CONTAM: hypothetical protein GTU68_005860 [Idotea baltica]|nr:hypothetical protein [Idotea baltica]